MTVGLFWGLRVLIGADVEISELFTPPRIEFTRLVHDSDTEQKVRVKPVIEKPEAPPVAPTVTTTSKSSVDPGTDLAALAPGVDYSGGSGGGLGIGGGGGGLAVQSGTDRDAVPQVRIDPEYPMRAQQQGVEGWVIVQYVVGKDGSVRDARALDAQPSGIFDRAAVQAVMSWKFSPAIRDGKPIETSLKAKINFEIDK
jgi:protein TonB